MRTSRSDNSRKPTGLVSFRGFAQGPWRRRTSHAICLFNHLRQPGGRTLKSTAEIGPLTQRIAHPITNNVSITLPMSADRQPAGFGSPLRMIRPAVDSYPILRLTLRSRFVHQRNGFSRAVIPSAFLSCFFACVRPRSVFHDIRRYLKNFI